MPLITRRNAGQAFVLRDKKTSQIIARVDTVRDDIGRIQYRIDAPQTVQIDRIDRKF